MKTNFDNLLAYISLGYGQLASRVRQALLLMLAAALLILGGCDASDAISKRALPAPIPDEETYEMVGRIRRMWGGDNFEFGKLQELHYVLVRGVDTPKPGQRLFGRARSYAWNMVNAGRQVRVEVKARDEMMREIADIYVINPDPADLRGEVNVGLEILRGGYGWFDGNEFEFTEQYKAAEASAREQKLGIWATENPIAPWDFEAQQREQRRLQLDKHQAATASDG